MKTNILKTVLFSALTAGMLTSCVDDSAYEIPKFNCTETTLVANKQVSNIVAVSTATVKQYTDDDVIEAYVTSSDEGGNFYKSISFQSVDGTVGFSVPVDVTSTFINFEPGRKVFVKLKDLYTDISYGSMRIGNLYASSSGNASVGRLNSTEYAKVLTRSCNVVSEETLVQKLSINDTKKDSNINKLIELSGVQFTDAAIGKNYYDPNNQVGGATNLLLTDATGNTIIFRTSSFAKYAYNPVANGSGKVRGVLTKYNTDYQFMARTEEDVKLTDPRLNIDFSAPIVGNDITYSGAFTEDFESYGTTSPANRVFPKYINDPVVGARYWSNVTFSNNKYIQMTSFGGTAEENRSLFYIPVDMTLANTFSFQSKAGYANGAVLKVYYVLAANYTPGGIVNNADLVDITSSFTLSPGSATGYPSTFTNSGSYSIPATVTGNGYFVFEYKGNGTTGLTTTMQIDNVVVN
jgi:Family of unknown function (DUF5689)